jgi:O-antigen/teichoic acid export membrane protein
VACMGENLSNIVEESARGGFFLFIGYFTSLVILAVGSMIVGRLLGPEGFGIFSLAFVPSTLILGFLDPGVGAALTRFTAKFRTENKFDVAASILRTGFLYKFIVSSIATILCFTFSESLAALLLNRSELGYFVRIASIIILFQTLFNFLGEAFSGLDRMEGNALILNIEAIVKSFLSPVLVILGFGVLGAIWGHVISYIAAFIIGLVFFLKLYRMLGKPAENSFFMNIKMMVSYGFPLYAANFLNTIASQVQVLVLAFFASNTEIGNFYVAARLLALVGVLAYPFSALFPAFSKVRKGSSELFQLFKLSTKYTSLVIVPATALIMVLSKDVVYTFYGRSYTLAPSYLTLYVVTNLFAGFGSIVFGHVFNGLGYTRLSFYSTLVNFVTFIPLVYILTSYYSVYGTLLAIIISQTFSMAYNIFASNRILGLKFDIVTSTKIYLTSFASALATVLAINVLSFPYWILNLIARGLLFFGLYLTFIPISKTISSYDIENIQFLIKRYSFFKIVLAPVIKYERMLLNFVEKN